MKKDDIIKILSEFKCEHILESGEHENIISEFDFDYIADRIIALGKPEPLTKNKQCDKDLLCLHPKRDFYQYCGLYSTDYCRDKCPSYNRGKD